MPAGAARSAAAMPNATEALATDPDVASVSHTGLPKGESTDSQLRESSPDAAPAPSTMMELSLAPLRGTPIRGLDPTRDGTPPPRGMDPTRAGTTVRGLDPTRAGTPVRGLDPTRAGTPVKGLEPPRGGTPPPRSSTPPASHLPSWGPADGIR